MTTIPPLDAAALPRDVRAAGPEAVDRFRTALGFERVLLGELLETALPEPSADAGPQPAQLHETFADALVANGGIGFGASLYDALAAQGGIGFGAGLDDALAAPAPKPAGAAPTPGARPAARPEPAA